jgi:hypothetical protein
MLSPACSAKQQGVLANLIAQWFRPASVVKDANTFEPQIGAHPLGMTNAGDGATDHDPVKTGQLTGDLISMPFGEIL